MKNNTVQDDINKINSFIIAKVGNNKRIEAKDIEINNFDELMTLFLVGVYSSNPLVNYSAKFSKKMDQESFTKQGRKMTNFVIIRKIGMDS